MGFHRNRTTAHHHRYKQKTPCHGLLQLSTTQFTKLAIRTVPLHASTVRNRDSKIKEVCGIGKRSTRATWDGPLCQRRNRSMHAIGAVVLVLCHGWKTGVVLRCRMVLDLQHIKQFLQLIGFVPADLARVPASLAENLINLTVFWECRNTTLF